MSETTADEFPYDPGLWEGTIMSIPQDIRETALTCAYRWTQFQRDQRKLAEIIAEALSAERQRAAQVCLDMPTTSGLERVYANRILEGWPAIRQSKEPVE